MRGAWRAPESPHQHRSRGGRRGPDGPGRRHRLVPLALRPAPGPGLSLGGHRARGGGPGEGGLAAGARPQPPLRLELLGDLHPAGARSDRASAARCNSTSSFRQDRRLADHRDGRALRQRALRPSAEPRVACRRSSGASGHGRPLVAGAAFGIAWTPASGPRSPPSSARRGFRIRPPTARRRSPSIPPASRSPSCSPPSPSAG